MLPNFKQPRIDNKKHRKFVASLPCVACRAGGHSQAAHIRHGNAGAGMKSGDDLTVPLCATWPDREGCHDVQGRGEVKFWERFGGIDKAQKLARDLFAVTGDWVKGCELIVRFR